MGCKAGLYGEHHLSGSSLHCPNARLETKLREEERELVSPDAGTLLRLWVLGRASQSRPSGLGVVG